jgi:hypothetical protein
MLGATTRYPLMAYYHLYAELLMLWLVPIFSKIGIDEFFLFLIWQKPFSRPLRGGTLFLFCIIA